MRGQITPGKSIDIVPLGGAGGPQNMSGDNYIGANKLRNYVEGGSWGIFRVHDGDAPVMSISEQTDGDNAPTVLSLSLSEDDSGDSPHANFIASWNVSDSDSDLDTVELTLTDLDDGETEDSASIDVSGADATGNTDLKAKKEENSGHEYEVEIVVTDAKDNMVSDTATEVEDGT